jgi:hypothetical protein
VRPWRLLAPQPTEFFMGAGEVDLKVGRAGVVPRDAMSWDG